MKTAKSSDTDLEKIKGVLDNNLKIGVQQENHPPYTEDNKPQGLVFVDGKDQAAQQLLDMMRGARYDELTSFVAQNHVTVPTAELAKRLTELKGEGK